MTIIRTQIITVSHHASTINNISSYGTTSRWEKTFRLMVSSYVFTTTDLSDTIKVISWYKQIHMYNITNIEHIVSTVYTVMHAVNITYVVIVLYYSNFSKYFAVVNH